jgi:hypothetical protein
MELVAQLYQSLLDNVDQVQKKQCKTYVAWGGWLLFVGFKVGDTWVKMKSGKNEKKLVRRNLCLPIWKCLWVIKMKREIKTMMKVAKYAFSKRRKSGFGKGQKETYKNTNICFEA